jgi:uncharacterized protein (TIGR00106 family)
VGTKIAFKQNNRKFHCKKGASMLFELSIYPLGDLHLSNALAGVLKIIHESKIPYKITPTGTCMEGEWDEVMNVIKVCHNKIREQSPHLITSIIIEDERGETNKLTQNIKSLENKVGFTLNH